MKSRQAITRSTAWDSPRLQRLERRQRRARRRRSTRSSADAGWRDATSVAEFVAAITSWARCSAWAQDVQLLLHAPGSEAAVITSPLRHTQPQYAQTTRGTARRVVLPLHAGARRVGTLRLQLHRPLRRRVIATFLRDAGPVLGRLLEREHALRQARRYEILLDNLPDWCILLLSKEGIVREIRGGFGSPRIRAAWLGHAFAAGGADQGIVELPRQRLRALLATTRRHGRAELETRLHLEARAVDVQLTLVDLRAGGEMLCLLRDLSSVRAMEFALLRRNQELSEAAERLQEIDMLKNEFLSNVSHELRTPLTAIIAYTEALQLNRPDETTREQFLRVIAEQGHKLQRLIAGLLDIAKLDSLATELKLQLGAVNDVIEAAVVTVRPTADKAHVELHFDLAPDLALVYLDELRTQQIVWNLLTNAIKFSPPGSTVRVRSWNAEGRVWVAVSDQGIGIAPEHHELIFQKFVQLDGSSTRRHGGVGLGLDLVKHLVELHGGSVHVDSDLGRGATFSFCIPVEKRRQPRFGASQRPARVGHRR